MRILIIRLSSLGDIIQTFPAIEDLKKNIPNIEIDWVIDQQFSELLSLKPDIHPIAIPLRQIKKSLSNLFKLKKFFSDLRKKNYDYIIDVQGLLKSAILSRFAKGKVFGLAKENAREKLASIFYQEKITINSNATLDIRTRELFAKIFNYPLPTTIADYGIATKRYPDSKNILFLHGTTWLTKHWPNHYWIQLAENAIKKGFTIQLPWYSEEELTRAKLIAANKNNIEILPKLALTELKKVIEQACLIVGVDTGLTHLAAAMNMPTILLYGPTDPKKVAALYGEQQLTLQADFPCAPCSQKVCTYDKPKTFDAEPPCFSTLKPDYVWQQAIKLLHAKQ